MLPTSLLHTFVALVAAPAQEAASLPMPVELQGARPAPRERMHVHLWDPAGPACILRKRGAGPLDPSRLPKPYRTPSISETYGPGMTETALAAGAARGHARPPKVFKGTSGAAWIVAYTDGASEGFNDPDLGPARRAALEYAAAKSMAMIEDGNIVISIAASMELLGIDDSTLASGAPTAYYQNSSFAFDDTWYGEPLYSHLDDADPDTDQFDITIQFNGSWDLSTTPYYYGTDLATPDGMMDFVSVAMHELGHGLDIVASFDGTGGLTAVDPTVFDHFLVDTSGTKLLDLPAVPSTVEGDDVRWRGSVANIGWNFRLGESGDLPMFAPTPFDAGSSLSHVDETLLPVGWDLMSPMLDDGEAHHHFDDIARGMLTDLGWTVDFQAVYVSSSVGLVQTGKPHQPWASLASAAADAASSNKTEVFLTHGTFDESSLVLDGPMLLRVLPGAIGSAVIE